MSEHTAENDAARMTRLRRYAETAMAGVEPKFRSEREDIFRVSDVLWLLDQADAARVLPPDEGRA